MVSSPEGNVPVDMPVYDILASIRLQESLLSYAEPARPVRLAGLS
jgi:hypothetical protein